MRKARAFRIPPSEAAAFDVCCPATPYERGPAPHLRSPSAAERKRGGKDPNASAAIVDFQNIKTTEGGGGSNGYDLHKNVKARKRHLLVDTLGMPFSIRVAPADVQDRATVAGGPPQSLAS
jgi:hypothetical protein